MNVIARSDKRSRIYAQQTELASLLSQIKARRIQPEDRYEIAAMLESMGWTDDRAAKSYGVLNVFELASLLWEMSRSNIVITPFERMEKIGFKEALSIMISNFFRGAIFALPMAVSVFSMITLRFSLWSYEDLALELATAIAIGTILSFVTVGGFTQAIARRGFFYIIQGYYRMARKVTVHFILLGTGACLLISGAIFIGNAFVHLFPYHMVSVIILYYFFLNLIWLSVTIMYILKKEIVFTGLIVLGIALVYVWFKVVGLSIIVSQLISLFFISILGLLLAVYFFKRAEARSEKGIEPKLPKMSVTFYNTLPYFVYGTLYFAFLFIDRIVAWSADNAFMPYLIWFRGDYELGMDFSLLVLIVPMGIIEVVLSRMMVNIEHSQKTYMGHEIKAMNSKYIRDYFLRVVLIFSVSAVCAGLLYIGIQEILQVLHPEMGDTIYHHPVTHFVFVSSLLSYTLLSIGLMNSVTLFSLSQPNKVIRSIVPAFVANLVVGFIMSRWFGYEYAVIGLIAGTVVFVILSSMQAYSVLRKLDYYIYAAS